VAVGDTAIANAYLPKGTGQETLERESLRDVVEMVSKEVTPLWSNLRKGTAKAMKEEWGTETIGTVTAAVNRKIGYVAAPTAAEVNRRLDNYLELMGLEGGVSDTMDALDAADGVNTYEHQLLKKGILHRRQINKLMHTPQVKDGTMSDPIMGTYATYIVAATFYGAAGTPGVVGSGNGVSLPTAGTTPADFNSITPIDVVLEAASFFTGSPDTAYFSPRMKRLFSRLPDASVAENRQTSTVGNKPFRHIGAVDSYLSDFGYIECVVDIDCPNTDIKIIDHDYVDVVVLPGLDMKEKELGTRGSAKEFMIETQATFRMLLPEANCYINGYKA
jgi:hypothetical protein